MTKRELELKTKTLIKVTIITMEIIIIIVIEITIMKKDLKITTKVKINSKALKGHSFLLDLKSLYYLFQLVVMKLRLKKFKFIQTNLK
jgi:hypothetical protein